MQSFLLWFGKNLEVRVIKIGSRVVRHARAIKIRLDARRPNNDVECAFGLLKITRCGSLKLSMFQSAKVGSIFDTRTLIQLL